jgi:uncharacterized pyridoxamine 5'-phosphate oxidase family protein
MNNDDQVVQDDALVDDAVVEAVEEPAVDEAIVASADADDVAVAADDAVAEPAADYADVSVPDTAQSIDEVVAEQAAAADAPTTVADDADLTEEAAASILANATPAATVDAVAVEDALDPSSVIARVGEFLAGVFYLATADSDQPHVRPFDSAVARDGKIYFATSNTKSVYKQLQRNPKVEIYAMNEDGSLRVSGIATESEDMDVSKEVLEQAGKYGGDPNLVVFYLTNLTGEMTGADGTKFPVTL